MLLLLKEAGTRALLGVRLVALFAWSVVVVVVVVELSDRGLGGRAARKRLGGGKNSFSKRSGMSVDSFAVPTGRREGTSVQIAE